MNKGVMEKKPVVAIGSFWNEVVATVAWQPSAERRAPGTQIVRLDRDAATCVEGLRRV
jgi:hypothetical protein